MKPKKPKITPSRNSVILVTWHTPAFFKENRMEWKQIYSGLTCFCNYNPEYNRETINSWIGRRKVPYVSETVRIEKIYIIRPSNKKTK